MVKLSQAEQLVVNENKLQQILNSVSSLVSKTTVLEGMVNGIEISSLKDIQDQIYLISSEIDIINSLGKVTGGDIYIQETQPIEPKENDIWFDLGSIK